MSNLGCLHLRLVNPYNVAFREARSAMGAAKVLAEAKQFETVGAAVSDCSLVVGTTAIRHRELQHPLRRLESGGRVIRKQLPLERVALLFGSEKTGLSNDDLSHCHWLLHIPTRKEHLSMNLGQAVAVCLYELARDKKVRLERGRIKLADSAKQEMITASLLGALRISGYINPRVAKSSEMKIRRMVRRLRLESEDAEVWLGMLRQILWKLDGDAAKKGREVLAKGIG